MKKNMMIETLSWNDKNINMKKNMKGIKI